jgi:SAM-dependent methyltransferase
MTDWTAGYVADIAYTYGYYAELNPARIKLAFLNAGLVPPEIGTACELGFGQGLSSNIHAAASIVKWHGTDFNPAQAGFAQELACASGASANLVDDTFAEFAQRPDLPEFDFIGIHGIWSWISDENRKLMVDFIKRKLKVGGVLYISYNTQPGWASFAPVRHLLTEHKKVMGSDGRGIVNCINGAIDFADQLFKTKPAFTATNPQVSGRFEALKGMNRHYLAHEYFNRDWHPMHFSIMAEWLEPAKVQFACSANYLDSVDVINCNAEQLTFLSQIPDPMFRQTVRDFIINQQFRKDYWVKGARQLSGHDKGEQMRKLRVLLVQPRKDVSLKVGCNLGEAALAESVYNPLLDALANHQPMSLAELELALVGKGSTGEGVDFRQIIEAILILTGNGALMIVQDDGSINKARLTTEKLNNFLLHKSIGSDEINFLASPVTGGAVAVNRFQQLFLLAYQSGLETAPEWAIDAWKHLVSQGQKLVKGDLILESAEENIAELTEQASVFAKSLMPILKALQIAR